MLRRSVLLGLGQAAKVGTIVLLSAFFFIAAPSQVAAAGPANDDFPGTEITSLPFSDTQDNTQATVEPGEPQPSCVGAGRTVWYSFTPSADMALKATTFGSDFDTTLAVYTGTSLADLTEVACNDDFQSLQSKVTFTAAAGQTYYFQVGGYFGQAAGDLVFHLEETTPPANDDFPGTAISEPLPFSDTVDTADATTELDEPQPSCAFPEYGVPMGATVWYSFTPTADTPVFADTFPSNYFAIIAVYTGTSLADLTEVACSFQSPARIGILALAGETYYFQVGGLFGGGGTLTFNLEEGTPPANDNFPGTAIPEPLPFSDSLNNIDATLEAGEPQPSCAFPEFGGSAGGTVWYSFTATTDTPVAADTSGSDFDTIVAVYTGTSLADLSEIACNTYFQGLQARVVFLATAGQTYYFQVGGLFGSFGTLVFSLDVAVPPANDNFPGSLIPEPLPFTDSVDTTDATLEAGEPQPSCLADFGGGINSTVWYRFTPSADTTLVADALESDFYPVIAAYRGTSLADLTEVACSTFMPVAFSAAAGQTYYFQVGGYYGDAGNLLLNLDTFVIPTCPDTQFSVEDPVGDAFGFQPPNHDIVSVSGGADAENFCLTVEFAGAVDPADAGTGQEVAGYIDFDTDENPDTGFGSAINFYCPDPSDLGVEATVNMFAVSGSLVMIYREETLDFAPILFDDTSFTIIIPLNLLGGDNSFNFAMVLGSRLAPTDCAPNGGFIHHPVLPLGDVNSDGEVTIVDAVLIAQYLVGLIESDALGLDSADVDGDGDVIMVDALLIAQYLVGLTPGFSPGEAETAESVGQGSDGPARKARISEWGAQTRFGDNPHLRFQHDLRLRFKD